MQGTSMSLRQLDKAEWEALSEYLQQGIRRL